jgi:hypothetical protein
MLTFEEYKSRMRGFTAYKLADTSRKVLLAHFGPKNPEVICEHVTVKFPAYSNDPLPTPAHEAHVVGYASEDGLEALVVEINGSPRRPDGMLFHLTLSLDRSKKKKPSLSNELLRRGYEKVPPIPIQLTPAFLT